ncbi:hypothetical protein GLW08_20650 [Pontibacillus yanchengensis]|uniref:Uncharacterized protein n=2 Tax=Pontibacillus yanchengensis TaxID=462910 RepID=A0ACC7VLU1_9BACI|nr:hypothetical protein [Pontibacillus yanchengensis]MYL55715.1 hypothetical protein [Pontibacillus yanchengensis]
MATFVVASVVVFCLAIYSFLGYRKEKREWKKKINDYYNEGEARKSIIVLLGDRFDQTDSAKLIRNKLRDANMPFTPSEYIGAIIVGFMGTVMFLQTFFNIDFLTAIVLSGLIVEAARRVLFIIRKNKMKEQLASQLPEICRLLANSTRSGMTLNQGIQMVAQEVNEPARGEFKRLAQELSLGVGFKSALNSMEERIDNREFKLFVATLLIQKKVGGNLHLILDEMSKTMEERKLLQQEIQTMTAEQRYISYILPVIPIFLVLMMNNIIDGFLDPLFSGVGIILLLFFILGTVLTFFLVRKVTNIRV